MRPWKSDGAVGERIPLKGGTLPEGRLEGVRGTAKRDRGTATVYRDGAMLETKLDLITKFTAS
jgi:hypothetical protein